MLFVRDKDQKFLQLKLQNCRRGAKRGHVIEIKDDDGTLSIDQKETDLRREKTKNCKIACGNKHEDTEKNLYA